MFVPRQILEPYDPCSRYLSSRALQPKFSYYLAQSLSAGGVLQGFMFPFNLGRLGNGISWWLGIHPYELFFYIFLPPLLCDSAVRIDFFLFKQV